MSGSYRSALDHSRGLRGAIGYGLVGAAVPALLAVGFAVLRWSASPGLTQFERWELVRPMAIPILGCAIMFSCAGWANSAPPGKHRFAISLGAVFLTSLVAWSVAVSILQPRHKGDDGPGIGTFLVVLIGPPVLAAEALTSIRLLRAWSGTTPDRTGAA